MAQTATDQCNEEHAEASSKGSHGSFCWNELMTHDAQRAKKFYADTIGWTFDPMPMDGALIGSPRRAIKWSAAFSR